MNACELTGKHCKPCEGGIPALSPAETEKYLGQVNGWKLVGVHIEKEFKLKDFAKALLFVNAVGYCAEQEGHHPDIVVHYNRVQVILWTHAISGLTENDFILASKIDLLCGVPEVL